MSRGGSSRRVRGYTLVALAIGITIMMVLIAAVLPLALTQMQREREEELIFRGRQYAEAIRCFNRKYGRNPTSLKEMITVRPRTLRQLWKDPITNSRDWGIITAGSVTPLMPGQGGGTSAGSSFGGSTSGGGTFGGGSFGGGRTGGGSPRATPTPVPTPDPFVFGGSTDGGGRKEGGDTSGGSSFGGPGTTGDAPILPVAGVYSKSHKKAFRTFMGRDVYDEWKFTIATLTQSGTSVETPTGGMGPGWGGGPSRQPPGGASTSGGK